MTEQMSDPTPPPVSVMRGTGPGRTSLIAGLFFGVAFGMGGIAAAAIGLMADRCGIEQVFLICSALAVLSILAIFLPDGMG